MADLTFTYCNECGEQADCLYDPPDGFICTDCFDVKQAPATSLDYNCMQKIGGL